MSSSSGTTSYLPGKGVHWLAIFTAVLAWFVIWAGGMVTSTNSGLSVPDWPLSYGMFFPPMIGGIFYEHGHRLVAGSLGIFTVLLAAVIWWKDNRRWVKWFAFGGVAAVIIQGVLGGLTVLNLLPPPLSISHAGVAEIFFCLSIALVAFTGPGWAGEVVKEEDHGAPLSLSALAFLTTAVVYIQIIVGAIMTHTGSGLAMPHFPFPLLPEVWTPGVRIHFLHRAGGFIALGFIAWLVARVAKNHSHQPKLLIPALGLAWVACFQVMLGAMVIWSERYPLTRTVHVAMGALTLGLSFFLTLRAFRYLTPASQKSGASAPKLGEAHS